MRLLAPFLTLLVVRFGAHASDFLSQGNEFYRQGDYARAVHSYQNAIAGNENPALSWYNMGNALYQSGKQHQAISCYEAAVAHAPDFPRGWVNLGVVYYELGDLGASIASLEHAKALERENAMVYSLLAVAHKELEHYGKAAIYLEQALELDSTLSDAFLMRYEIARMTGDNGEALRWLSAYPRTGARYYDVVLLTGELALERGDTAAALGSFRRCTRLAPGKPRGWIELVNVLHRTNAAYTAVLEAERAFENGVSSGALALAAGRIAFDAGYFDKAERFYAIALREGHSDAAVGLNNLMLTYERFHDNEGMKRIEAVAGYAQRTK